MPLIAYSCKQTADKRSASTGIFFVCEIKLCSLKIVCYHFPVPDISCFAKAVRRSVLLFDLQCFIRKFSPSCLCRALRDKYLNLPFSHVHSSKVSPHFRMIYPFGHDCWTRYNHCPFALQMPSLRFHSGNTPPQKYKEGNLWFPLGTELKEIARKCCRVALVALLSKHCRPWQITKIWMFLQLF